MLERKDDGDTNIGDAMALIEELELLHSSEYSLHLEKMNKIISALLREQRTGFDGPVLRQTIAKLSRFREAAKE